MTIVSNMVTYLHSSIGLYVSIYEVNFKISVSQSSLCVNFVGVPKYIHKNIHKFILFLVIINFMM